MFHPRRTVVVAKNVHFSRDDNYFIVGDATLLILDCGHVAHNDRVKVGDEVTCYRCPKGGA